MLTFEFFSKKWIVFLVESLEENLYMLIFEFIKAPDENFFQTTKEKETERKKTYSNSTRLRMNLIGVFMSTSTVQRGSLAYSFHFLMSHTDFLCMAITQRVSIKVTLFLAISTKREYCASTYQWLIIWTINTRQKDVMESVMLDQSIMYTTFLSNGAYQMRRNRYAVAKFHRHAFTC